MELLLQDNLDDKGAFARKGGVNRSSGKNKKGACMYVCIYVCMYVSM